MPEPSIVLFLTIAGGLLNLDRVAFLQSMASRPLPAAALAGLLAGEPGLGLVTGLYMELVWLSRLPVGGAVPPDDTLASLAAVLAASALPPGWHVGARAAAGVLVGLPYGLMGRRLDLLARARNERLLHEVRASLARGDDRAPGRAQMRGALNFLAAGSVGAAIAALTAKPLGALIFGALPSGAEGAMEIMAFLLPVVGAGTILASIAGRTPKVLFAAGGLTGLLCLKAGLKVGAGLLSGGKGPG